MAIDLSAITKAAKIQDVALHATAANCVDVTLPTWCRKVAISFVQSDKATADTGSLADAGTDGNAQSDDALPIGSGGVYEHIVSPGRTRDLNGAHLFLSAGTNSAYARLDMDS